MLSTVERLKRALSLPLEDTTQDGILEFYFRVASNAIETYCKRKFGLSRHQEVLDGTCRKYISLSNYPIHEVSSIISYGRPLTGFEIDHAKGMLYRSSWP